MGDAHSTRTRICRVKSSVALRPVLLPKGSLGLRHHPTSGAAKPPTVCPWNPGTES